MADTVSNLTVYYDDFAGAPSFQKGRFWDTLQERLTTEPHLANDHNVRLAVRMAMNDMHQDVRNNALRTALTIVYHNQTTLAFALEEAVNYQNHLLSQSMDDRTRTRIEENAKPVISVLTNLREAARSDHNSSLKTARQALIPQ